MKVYKYRKSFTYDGKRYYVRGDTLEQVYEKMALLKRDLAEGRIVANASTTLSAWAEKCIDTYKPNQKDSTRETFRRFVRSTILSDLGGVRVSKVKPSDCQAIMNAQAGKSATQINMTYQALRFLFKYAVVDGLVSSDPTEHIIKPEHAPAKHRRALTPQEREIAILTAETDRRYYLYLLMIFCGCRPSEAAEAMGKDIVIHDGIPLLHIRGTKTRFSDRFVPVPDKLYQIIRNTRENECIALSGANKPIPPYRFRRVWLSFWRACNRAAGCATYRNALIPPYPFGADLVPYCLRHEYCTELARRGVDIRTAQRLMGHSSVQLTANIYTNLEAADMTAAAKLLGCTQGARLSDTE